MVRAIVDFPLFRKAREAGILDDGNALIVAPTATGKSYIGRTILRKAVGRGEPGPHVYLVPYRALASEIYDVFLRELNGEGIEARVRVATGDHTDPIYPQETDILIATYERFSGLLQNSDISIGRVVIDEAHLIADETRGPVVEGLIARMKSHKRPKSLCALSAVVSNPEDLAAWLGVRLLLGSPADRTIKITLSCEVADDVDGQLAKQISEALKQGEQAIVFCSSKAASQRVVRDLKPVISRFVDDFDLEALRGLAFEVAQDEEEAQELLDLLSDGIAYHHAGLSRDSRKAVETAFRDKRLKVIACTPTLAAGVNLPAHLVIVRDVFRTELVRGLPRKVMLSTGELINMLGRAGRPGQVERGRGVAFIKRDALEKDELSKLEVAISDGRGDPVVSQMPVSFDVLMRFLLSVAVDRGEVTLFDLAEAVKATFWYYERPTEISFDRSFEADIMEDIPAFERVTKEMRVECAWTVPDGVAGSVVSGSNKYNFGLRLIGADCSCPARSKWQRRAICKHLACAINYLLFDSSVEQEIRDRAIYASAHLFSKTLDLGTKINVAVSLLESWDLLEPVPAGFQPTPVGALAANSRLDLLLIRTARDRIRELQGAPTADELATWVVEDYFSEEQKRERWLKAIIPWINEVDIKRIKLPEKYRGDFDSGRETLGQLMTLYGEIAQSMGKPEVAEACRKARGYIEYGVFPELIPLASLRIPQLGRARCRILYKEHGIRNCEDLANADPKDLAGAHIPLKIAAQWVERAKGMMHERNRVVDAPEYERNRRIDDFLARFQVDHLSLFGDNAILSHAKEDCG